jgi:hypothetical protein
MIVLAAAMLMAGTAGPAAPSMERRALGACLTKFVHDKLSDKMDAVAFKAAAKTACAAQQTAFRTAWVSYDVAMKSSRAEAEENADSQVEDYLQNSAESYADATTPAAPRPPGTPSPVTPASSPAPASATPLTPASSPTPPKP